MILAEPAASRPLKKDELKADLCVVGGGMAGVCASLTAARAGLKVVLVQDRPVLGGNGSSEVRLWLLGANAHMGSNNRYAREGGVINEIVLENLWRNPEGNPLIFDTIVLEKVAEEKNITLLLNTAAFACTKSDDDPDRIRSVEAFCSQNSTAYHVEAPLFVDSSGDGILGFFSGAAFRVGAESRGEFDEAFAPQGDFGHLLGHSIYFYSKNTGRPVKFVAPSFALKNVDEVIPRYQQFNAGTDGCRLWWIEWGGRLDTVHDSEKIKWELWRVVYGVWDYIKNSGKFPDAANLTLEWIGHIPGKRESRRFEGPYMLSQKDIVQRRLHDDAVAFGGWSIDLHPADGVYAKIAGSHHLHSKGVYQIPYRCYYSRNIKNLFLAGRIISTTHVAFGSTRVILTCSLGGQAVGQAAALCLEENCLPADISTDPAKIKRLQRDLARFGHDQWGIVIPDEENLAADARVTATSSLQLTSLPADGDVRVLEGKAWAQIIPLPAGPVPAITFCLDSTKPVELTFELRASSRRDHHTPDTIVSSIKQRVPAGNKSPVTLNFPYAMPAAGSVFVTVQPPASATFAAADAPVIGLHTSRRMLTGLLALYNGWQEATSPVGGEDFPVYQPLRRPKEQNLAFTLGRSVNAHAPANVINGAIRPLDKPNAWIADFDDTAPALTLEWDAPRKISRVDLFFDCDYDHQLETVLYGHPENVIPYCAKRWRLRDDQSQILHECAENHQALNRVRLSPALTTQKLRLEILEMNGPVPATVMEVRCY
jgi:FAD dependent oxidoreductase